MLSKWTRGSIRIALLWCDPGCLGILFPVYIINTPTLSLPAPSLSHSKENLSLSSPLSPPLPPSLTDPELLELELYPKVTDAEGAEEALLLHLVHLLPRPAPLFLVPKCLLASGA